MYHLLFVCTANLYRSPLAAALFSRKLQQEGQASSWIVESAGTWTVPGQHVPSAVLKAARAIDIDLTNHLTRQVGEALVSGFDLIIVMEKGHREALRIEFPVIREKILLLSQVADRLEYDILDPAKSPANVEEAVERMRELIDRAYANIFQFVQTPDRLQRPFRRAVNVTL